MAKRVYKPNPVLDTTLFLSFSSLAAYVVYVTQIPGNFRFRLQYFKEGVLFWTLILSTALVSILVPIVEHFLRVGGQWFSHTFLNDERHRIVTFVDMIDRRSTLEGLCPQEVCWPGMNANHNFIGCRDGNLSTTPFSPFGSTVFSESTTGSRMVPCGIPLPTIWWFLWTFELCSLYRSYGMCIT